jgi:tripartite-type tricarboxylate transporter receptor subunit TctC
VPADSPFKSLADLIAYAKTHPGELNAASVGIGSTSYLATALFKSVAQIDVTIVPYNGAGPASTDIIGGRLNLWVTTLGSVLPPIRNGQMRALAITGDRRTSDLPDVPTFAEAGYPGMKANAWFALFTPAGTSKDVILRLNADVNAALTVDDVRTRFHTVSVEPGGGTPEALGTLLRDEIQTWKQLFDKNGTAQR